MKKCRVIIVKTNTKNLQYGPLKEFSAIEPPIWHALLASYYDAGAILDAEVEDLDDTKTVERIMEYDPDRIVILATGSHPSAFVQQKQSIIKLNILLEKYKREVITLHKLHVHVDHLDPRWKLLPMDKYRTHNWHSFTNDCNTVPYGVTYTSTSCPFSCSFCTVKNFYGDKYRERPIDRILRDLNKFADLKIKNVKFMDELFIFRKDRVHEICDKIISNGYNFNIWAYARIDIMDRPLLEKLRKAGVRWLAYGIEAGNDNIRKDVLKGNFTKEKIKEVIQMTKDYDICIIGNYMFGFWEDSLSTMQETLDLSLELNCEYVNFYCLSVFPETVLYNEYLEKGISLPTDYNQYAQTYSGFKPLPTKYVTAQEVLKFRDNAFRTYFSDPNYLNMINKKFGMKTLDNINKMINVPFKRKN